MDRGFSIEMQGEVCRVTFPPGTVITPEMIKEAITAERLVDRREVQKDIWDFRGCVPAEGFDFDTMRRIISFITNSRDKAWNSKTAFLVDENLVYGLMRMFLSLSGRMTSDVCVFYQESEAYEFLGLGRE